MSADLGTRDIIGTYYAALEQDPAIALVNELSMFFTSDQESETYRWLGQSPQMREWVGGREPKAFRTSGVTIENKMFEATIKVLVDELRRDKTGQIMIRVRDLATRTASHWLKLLSTQMINGESVACYDGQFYYDTDHSEGSSGTQSNDITVTLSSLPIVAGPDAGDPHDPSIDQAVYVVKKLVEQLLSFKDDQGEPINETARSFLLMCPTQQWGTYQSALTLMNLSHGVGNPLQGLISDGMRFRAVANPRLNTAWGASPGSPDVSKVAIFRTDAPVKAFIAQEEVGVMMSVIGAGSEHAIKYREHLYGVEASRNVGYGMWQYSCLATLA